MTSSTKSILAIGLGSLMALTACKPAPTSPSIATMPGHDMSSDHAGMAGMPPTKSPMSAQNLSPASQAYVNANAAMHKDMAINLSGDADRDFMAAMVPHHQGAVTMAQTVLQYGKDPQVRKLALDVIATQEKEIAQMKDWLAKGSDPTSVSPAK